MKHGTLAVWCGNIGSRYGDIGARSSDAGACSGDISAWHEVSDVITNCGVSITRQMCNRVTNR